MVAPTPTVPAAEQQHVLQVLVQEAQQEIGNLRAELYSTRRLADERRQALEAMTTARDQLAAVAQQLDVRVQAMHVQTMQLPQLQQELITLQELHQRMQKDQQLQSQARRILESELADERAARTAAEEARAKAESDRARLQLVQDDLAAQVRFAQQKAADAEEEQLRAEEEAVLLRKELEMHGGVGSADFTADTNSADVATLRTELHAQQARTASLMQALQDVQADASAYKAEAAKLRQRLEEASKHPAETTASSSDDDPVEKLLQQLQRLQEEQVALQTRTGLAESQLAAARDQIISLQQQLAEADARAADPAGEGHMTSKGAGAAHVTAVTANTSDTDDGLAEQVELLMSKVIMLKKSRDKLLAQMDRQSMEIEQMAMESQALAESSASWEKEREQWQTQAQDSISTISKLQELLAEGASWEAVQDGRSSSVAVSGPESSAEHFNTAVQSGQNDVAALHASLLKEKARCAQLDLQVRVLAAQLVRACAAYKSVGRSLLPMLSSVESKLVLLKGQTSLAVARS